MTRPDYRTLEFLAYRREGGEGKWLPLGESFPIPPGILLPDYKPIEAVTLPESVVGDGAAGGGMAVG